MKKIIYLLWVTIWGVSCTTNDLTSVLQQSKEKLCAIQSASYVTIDTYWDPNMEEMEDAKTSLSYMVVQDNPSDPYTGCRYISSTEDNKIMLCYDGIRRMRTNVKQEGTYEIDSLFKGISKYRVLEVPFYYTCRRIIDYALNPTDSVQISLSESDTLYTVDLVIYGKAPVEFSFACLDPHSPIYPKHICQDPTSHFILKIDRRTMLPVEYCRFMFNQCSIARVVGTPCFNQGHSTPINCYEQIPEGYTELKSKSTNARSKGLIGQLSPVWTLRDETERDISLDLKNGRRKLLMFTGIGCGPCKAAIPFMNQMSKQFDIDVFALECWGDDAAKVKAYRKAYNLNYPLLVGGKEVLSFYQLGPSVPQFVLISEQGYITAHYNGWNNGVGDSIKSKMKIN